MNPQPARDDPCARPICLDALPSPGISVLSPNSCCRFRCRADPQPDQLGTNRAGHFRLTGCRGAHRSHIERLTPDSERQWGKMTVAQMLAHNCIPFETVYDPAYAQEHPRPNFVLRAVLRLLVKPIVVGPKPYKRGMRTAPAFIIEGSRDFASEQARLTDYVRQVQDEGAPAFDGRESHSFGALTAGEWSTLFYKHTDHHLVQFGV